MKRIPILILCIGEQGASVLSKTFNLCGMSLGNEKTYWHPEYNTPNWEHSYVTAIMAWVHQRPKEEWQLALRKVLQSYKAEAENENWKCYGIKTSSGICNSKWGMGVSDILKEEWPDALYFSVLRRPNVNHPDANDHWNSVWVGRKGIVDRGGVFVLFPDAWLDGTIQKVIEASGLVWKEEAISAFEKREAETPLPTIEEEKVYYDIYPIEKEQRDYLWNKNKENFQRMKEMK